MRHVDDAHQPVRDRQAEGDQEQHRAEADAGEDDGEALAPVLAEAKKQNATVIAYDRLINGTADVDYYATFDNYKVGQLQGQYIESTLDLANAAGPFTLEPFAGSPDDNNATFFWNGAMDTLKPYMDKGVLKVPSGQTEFGQAAILRWLPETAQKRMENILTVIGGTVDLVGLEVSAVVEGSLPTDDPRELLSLG